MLSDNDSYASLVDSLSTLVLLIVRLPLSGILCFVFLVDILCLCLSGGYFVSGSNIKKSLHINRFQIICFTLIFRLVWENA